MEFYQRINDSPVKPALKIVEPGQTKGHARSRYKVPNLERGLLIMEHLMGFPQGLQQSEIAAQLHCSKTSVFRITMTLLEFGYLVRDEETKALRLSRKLIAMGNRTLGEDDLMSTAVDILKKLRDQVRETVLLGTLVDHELVVLGQVLGSHPFKFSIDLGTRVPLHTAAPGKAILAHLPENERDQILRKMSFEKFNERTISSVESFIRELELVKRDGYGLDRGEQLTGIHCVAAPVFNRHGYPIAAAWTTGPTDRIRETDFEKIGAWVKAHALAISERLGYGLLNGNGKNHGNNGTTPHETH
jgi:DNA-binding IclR family transcriptional regulator